MRRLLALLLRYADRERWPAVVACVAFVISLPCALTPYFGDDLLHNYLLRGNRFPGGPRGEWDLYRFADGEDGIRECLAQGIFPWWSTPNLKLSFFRPLASLWRVVDHALWGESPLLPHLETCLVYAGVAVVAALFYRRVIGGAAAGLAALLFAIDDAHALPVTWTANRYAVLAALFAFASLLAHVRAREASGSRLASPLLFGLALLSGETALGVLGYFLAYAWLADPRGRRAGLVAVAPLAIPFAAWAALYHALHFGAHGSAFYIDPVDAPARFAEALPLRLPLLAMGQIFAPPAEVWALVPGSPFAHALVAAVVSGLLLFVVVRTARAHRATRVLLIGALLAAVPVCGVSADDRVLLVPGLGVSGALAIALEAHVRSYTERPPWLGRRVLFGVLTLVHVFLAALMFPLQGRNTAATLTGVTNRTEASIPMDPGIDGKTLVILGGPDALTTSLAFIRRMLSDAPRPRRAFQLTTQLAGAATVSRTSVRELEVKNPDGENGGPFGAVFRAAPFRVGEVVQTDGHRAEVIALAPNGLPSVVRFTFEEPLEAMRFVVWQGQRFVEVEPPRIGESATYPSTDLLTFLQP